MNPNKLINLNFPWKHKANLGCLMFSGGNKLINSFKFTKSRARFEEGFESNQTYLLPLNSAQLPWAIFRTPKFKFWFKPNVKHCILKGEYLPFFIYFILMFLNLKHIENINFVKKIFQFCHHASFIHAIYSPSASV